MISLKCCATQPTRYQSRGNLGISHPGKEHRSVLLRTHSIIKNKLVLLIEHKKRFASIRSARLSGNSSRPGMSLISYPNVLNCKGHISSSLSGIFHFLTIHLKPFYRSHFVHQRCYFPITCGSRAFQFHPQ